jgi:hypothetical protein
MAFLLTSFNPTALWIKVFHNSGRGTSIGANLDGWDVKHSGSNVLSLDFIL